MKKQTKMNRQQFLDEVRRRGYPARWHIAQYTLEAEYLPQPERDERGNRVYTQEHVDALIAYLKTHQPQAVA